MSALALETKSLWKKFGALAVASDINFQLERGARHALIERPVRPARHARCGACGQP